MQEQRASAPGMHLNTSCGDRCQLAKHAAFCAPRVFHRHLVSPVHMCIHAHAHLGVHEASCVQLKVEGDVPRHLGQAPLAVVPEALEVHRQQLGRPAAKTAVVQRTGGLRSKWSCRGLEAMPSMVR